MSLSGDFNDGIYLNFYLPWLAMFLCFQRLISQLISCKECLDQHCPSLAACLLPCVILIMMLDCINWLVKGT